MDTERTAIRHELYPTLSRQPQRAGWSPGYVTVKMERPSEGIAVEAWRRGPFAVHETVSGATLTHAPTGLAVYRFDDMEQAAECAERIEGIADFASVKKAYPSGSEVYPKVRAVIDEIEERSSQCRINEAPMADEKLRQFTKSLRDTLLGLRPLGGSECFMRVGEDFYADYRYFGRVIEEQRNSLDELRRSEVRQQREIALLRAAQEWQDISTALKQAVAYADIVAQSEGMPAGKRAGKLTATTVNLDGTGFDTVEFDVKKARAALDALIADHRTK